jgi:hypothetical protein
VRSVAARNTQASAESASPKRERSCFWTLSGGGNQGPVDGRLGVGGEQRCGSRVVWAASDCSPLFLTGTSGSSVPESGFVCSPDRNLLRRARVPVASGAILFYRHGGKLPPSWILTGSTTPGRRASDCTPTQTTAPRSGSLYALSVPSVVTPTPTMARDSVSATPCTICDRSGRQNRKEPMGGRGSEVVSIPLTWDSIPGRIPCVFMSVILPSLSRPIFSQPRCPRSWALLLRPKYAKTG